MNRTGIGALAVVLALSWQVTGAQTAVKKPAVRAKPATQRAPAVPRPPTAQQHFYEAFEHFRAGRSAQAIERFRAGLALEPGNAQAWYFLGEAQKAQGDLDAARAAYAEAAKLGSGEAGDNARKRIAELPAKTYAAPALPQPDRAAALESLRKATDLAAQAMQEDLFDSSVSALVQLAEAKIEAGDRAGALALLKTLADAVPRRQRFFADVNSAGARAGQARSLASIAVVQARAASADGPPIIGVVMRDMTPEEARAAGIPSSRGAFVHSVANGKPAHRAGIRAGDIIVSFQGTEIENRTGLPDIVSRAKPWERVAVRVLRAGQLRDFELTLAKSHRLPATIAAEALETARRAHQTAEAVVPAFKSGDEDTERRYAVEAFAFVAFAYWTLGDLPNANVAYRQALAEVRASGEGLRSERHASVAVIRVQAGDVKGATEMEGMIKARHPKFHVGHAWHRVVLAQALPLASQGRYEEAARLAAQTDDESGYYASSNLKKLVRIALDRGDVAPAESMAATIVDEGIRVEALVQVARAYALRNDLRGMERAAVRINAVRDATKSAPVQPLLLAALGRAQEAQAAVTRAASDYDRAAARQALVEGLALGGDFAQAEKLLDTIEQSYRQSNAMTTIATVAAWRDPATAERFARMEAFQSQMPEVVAARVRAWDFDGARRLAEAAGPQAVRAMALELAELGYWDEALKHAGAMTGDFEFWARVGHAQAGLAWVNLFGSLP